MTSGEGGDGFMEDFPLADGGWETGTDRCFGWSTAGETTENPTRAEKIGRIALAVNVCWQTLNDLASSNR